MSERFDVRPVVSFESFGLSGELLKGLKKEHNDELPLREIKLTILRLYSCHKNLVLQVKIFGN